MCALCTPMDDPRSAGYWVTDFLLSVQPCLPQRSELIYKTNRQPQAYFIGPSYQARHRTKEKKKVYKTSQKGTPREEKEMRGIFSSPLKIQLPTHVHVSCPHKSSSKSPYPSPLPRFSSSFWEMQKGGGAGGYTMCL